MGLCVVVPSVQIVCSKSGSGSVHVTVIMNVTVMTRVMVIMNVTVMTRVTVIMNITIITRVLLS